MLGENTALSEKAVSGRAPAVLCDRFVLEERLEQGRIGTMYRAVDRLRGQDGRAYVAVLILPPEVGRDPEQLAVFERELDAVRMLSHPNIVRIFGLERDGDRTFLVLEWVDGESLRSILDSLAPETVCEADALGVVRAVGNALVYAHARGVVHGDIRPENVLVTERGEVRLLFASSCLARTAPFAIGPRDDVRGLAALAYELMSGSPPPIMGLDPRSKADEPEPIEGLGRKRWKALKSALSMRDGKISSVRRLLAALDLPEPRAPRPGSRPDRIRRRRGGTLKRVALGGALCASLAVLAAFGLRIWSERGDELAGLGATVESGASRAADLTRDGLSGARAGIARAGDALVGLWGEVGRRADTGDGAEAPQSTAGGAVRESELFETGELNGSNASQPVSGQEPAADGGGDGAPSAPVTSQASASTASAAAETNAAPAAAEEAAPRPGEASAAADSGTAPAAETTARPSADDTSTTLSAADANTDADGGESDADAAAAADSNVADPRSASTIVFSRREYSVAESDGVVAVEVERDGARGSVSFVWWTSDASAQSGDDYADLGRRIEQFRDGEAVKTLYVPITSDSIVEDRREYFEIHLGVLSEEGNQSGALESARVTIVDDDR